MPEIRTQVLVALKLLAEKKPATAAEALTLLKKEGNCKLLLTSSIASVLSEVTIADLFAISDIVDQK